MSQEWVFGIHAVAALLARNPERVAEVVALDGRVDKRMQQLLQQAERHLTNMGIKEVFLFIDQKSAKMVNFLKKQKYELTGSYDCLAKKLK